VPNLIGIAAERASPIVAAFVALPFAGWEWGSIRAIGMMAMLNRRNTTILTYPGELAIPLAAYHCARIECKVVASVSVLWAILNADRATVLAG
jgi:hypothetical protein